MQNSDLQLPSSVRIQVLEGGNSYLSQKLPYAEIHSSFLYAHIKKTSSQLPLPSRCYILRATSAMPWEMHEKAHNHIPQESEYHKTPSIHSLHLHKGIQQTVPHSSTFTARRLKSLTKYLYIYFIIMPLINLK